MVAKSTGTRYQYQSLFGAGEPGAASNSNVEFTIGTRFRFGAAGRIVGVRYYRDYASYGQNVGMLLSIPNGGTILRSALFVEREAESGPEGGEWQNTYFQKFLRVAPTDELTVAVYMPQGYHWSEPFGLDGQSVVAADIEAIEDGDGGANGVFIFGAGWNLDLSYQSSLYGVDVLFLADTEVA